MRSIFLLLVCLCLTSCFGAKPHPKPFKLATAQIDKPNLEAISGDWWTLFDNKQLIELIQTALSESPTMQIAGARLDRAKALANISRTTLFPLANGYVNIGRERLSENTFWPPPFAGNNITESNLGINFNYELDLWGKNRHAFLATLDEVKATTADAAAARLVLATAVVQSYVQLQYYSLILKTSQSILHDQQQLLSIIKDRAKQGVESDIPVTTAKATIETVQLNVMRLQEQVKLAHNQLITLLGQNPFINSIDPLPFHFEKKYLHIPKIIPADLIARRPDVLAALWRAQAAAAQVKVAKTQFLPNINLQALFSFQSFDLPKIINWGSRDYSYGAAINLPIFDAGLRLANLDQKYAEYDLAVANYNQVLLNALHDAADTLATLNSVKQQLRAEVKAYKATYQNYKLIRSRYHHGIVDYMNVLDAQSRFLTEKNKLIELEALHLNAMVGLVKALGGTYIIEV